MNVSRVDGFTSVTSRVRGAGFEDSSRIGSGFNPATGAKVSEVELPPNGNPGIVPPWLQGGFHILPWPFPIVPTDPVIGVELIGVAPVDPNTPHIM